jgi:hypothetical protein
MPHRFQISRDSQALFLTINTRNRLPVFRKDELKKVLCDAFDEARKSAGLLLFASVIMIDPLHVITDYKWSSARIWQGCPFDDEPLLMDIDRIMWRRSKFGA